MSRYLSVNEIALELDVSTRTVYRMLEGGLLKGFKTGRVWRVSRNDLSDFMADKSNSEFMMDNSSPDLAAGPQIISQFAPELVRAYEELAFAPPGSRHKSSYRVLLEKCTEGGSAELFELPLVVEQKRGIMKLSIRGDEADSIILPGPDKRQAAILRFLQSDTSLWPKVQVCLVSIGGPFDWAQAFKQKNLDASDRTALQWAYNLDDSASRPRIEEASVSDRLSLLEQMSPLQRRAALASLESLYDDDMES